MQSLLCLIWSLDALHSSKASKIAASKQVVASAFTHCLLSDKHFYQCRKFGVSSQCSHPKITATHRVIEPWMKRDKWGKVLNVKLLSLCNGPWKELKGSDFNSWTSNDATRNGLKPRSVTQPSFQGPQGVFATFALVHRLLVGCGDSYLRNRPEWSFICRHKSSRTGTKLPKSEKCNPLKIADTCLNTELNMGYLSSKNRRSVLWPVHSCFFFFYPSQELLIIIINLIMTSGY